ncbi:MAG: 23S rRNA (pseudouridine(1915)-N(3))-methyltransferase RlmH [Chitinispirillales bacterium]|jgi:23S rRNA (pseudouridine1915-N3)-methyltransferase|nr:23S rRNA (pseudouridine(1915)-N(3))-methyltransferase RlmH [Chitinispirillales bacterium]
MKISIIAVGKIKENYIKDAISEYSKRLSAFAKVRIIEINDEKCSENLSETEKRIVTDKEGKKIISQINKSDFVYSLAINGKKLSSQDFSVQIQNNMNNGYGNLVFVIGGSLGLSNEVLEAGDFRLSFSDMTFPHQIMRLILLEQIYRCFKIIGNEPYHK